MSEAPARGRLRVYLGAAPGVGKTHAMLDEGVRRAGRGTRVVAALVETHDRPRLHALLEQLDVVPATALGAVDVPAVLDREPDVVLVDGLGEANPEGCPRSHRWEDVEVLLERGIDVVTTLDISRIASLADVVRTVTGTAPPATVPDAVVRAADQVELVDMAPEALRRRLAHGTLFPPEQVDAAVSRYYRIGTLAALRELALLWLADRVEDQLESYRQQQGIGELWATRERIVVALTGGAESAALLRRAARVAARSSGAELHAVHVGSSRRGRPADELARLRSLTQDLGGTYHYVLADDVATAVLDLAHGLNATQVVVGESSRSRWRRLFTRGVSERVIQEAGDLDVLVVTHHTHHPLTGPVPPSPLGRMRTTWGWLLAVVGPALLTVVLRSRTSENLALEAMSFLAVVVATALVGGWWPAAAAALVSAGALNWFFTHPLHTLSVATYADVVTLLLLLVVAAGVARVVDVSARRTRQAAQVTSESELLAMLNRRLLTGEHTTRGILQQVRETFRATSAALVRVGDGGAVVDQVGAAAADGSADAGSVSVPVAADLHLLVTGVRPTSAEQRVLGAFATHLKAAHERESLATRARLAEERESGNRVRAALLSAVSHDLRTPLAGIKAAVSSLRSDQVEWSEADRAELLASIEGSTDRLTRIVSNLLDLSRVQAEAVRPVVAPTDLGEVAGSVVAEMDHDDRVHLREDPDVPAASADPGLVERVVANLVHNALTQSPGRVEVVVSAAADTVQLRVVDRGPGVSDADKPRMFTAFQQLDDGSGDRGRGLGLGLAVARGLVEAMAGRLVPEDTPGGGLTMVVELPAHVAEEASSPTGRSVS